MPIVTHAGIAHGSCAVGWPGLALYASSRCWIVLLLSLHCSLGEE